MATYTTIHTNYGLRQMAKAEATGKPINLVVMAVGDGNGNPVKPDPEQTHLVREIAATRGVPNRVYQEPDDPTTYYAELIIPADVAGFTMREWGIFDDTGGLVAVGNLPASYKPMAEEGAYGDFIVRVKFKVTNASVVTILVDPNVAVASRAWVVTNITVAHLMPGGLTGQVWRKDSNADGDASWHDPAQTNVVVNTIEEAQVLAEGQLVVDLAITNTRGLAVYIDGKRLQADQWAPHPTMLTRLTLAQDYPEGMPLIAVQNEPASHLEGVLERNQNLGDLEDKAKARENLDVYSRDQVDEKAPVGMVAYFASETAPSGWLKANGANVSRSAFPELYAVIGETWGKGDGFNTFQLPDLRGEFIRGLDDGRGVDKDRKLGVSQASQNLAHGHSGSTDTAGSHSHSYVDGRPVHPPGDAGLGNGSTFKGIWESNDLRTTQASGSHWHSLSISQSGGTEARPRNIALLACIKF